jgi:hypothetical protein
MYRYSARGVKHSTAGIIDVCDGMAGGLMGHGRATGQKVACSWCLVLLPSYCTSIQDHTAHRVSGAVLESSMMTDQSCAAA